MELLQNADDNTYPSGVTPTVELHVRQHGIALYNNEAGFRPADIQALCDVGASTKSATSPKLAGTHPPTVAAVPSSNSIACMGYIGSKGIGFKSVFRVSNRPEVHSGGYHVRFDRESDPALGYIMPTWISGCPCGVV